jgi:hypothetical protein
MPGRNTGIHQMSDLLAVQNQSPIEFGLDAIVASLAADLAVHNRLTNEMISTFAVTTKDRRRRYGTSDQIDFKEKDEFTRSHTQKVTSGSVVEFPLKGFQAAIGWTAMYFQNKSVADMAMSQNAVKAGHVTRIRRELQKSMYGAANYVWNDYLVDQIDLNVKRFVNADGAPIPMGPNGEQWDATTHTHYLFHNGLDDTSATALVATVVEHHQGGNVVIYINSGNEAQWRALANFKPFTDVRLTVPDNAAQPLQRLLNANTADRAIGLYGAATVWVKPWALLDYATAIDLAAPKPLVCRTRTGAPINLSTVATNVLFPLQADYMESEFGFGVWSRTNGAVLYHAAGAVAYVDPVIP